MQKYSFESIPPALRLEHPVLLFIMRKRSSGTVRKGEVPRKRYRTPPHNTARSSLDMTRNKLNAPLSLRSFLR